MVKNKLAYCAFLSIFFSANYSYAQKNVDIQNLVWLRYNLGLELNEKFKLRYELEERSYISPIRQHQIVSKLHIERFLNENWMAGLGIAYSEQSLPNDASIPVTQIQKEIRPQIEIENKQLLLQKVMLSHRYWTELRYFQDSNGSYEFSNVRCRYKLEINYKLNQYTSFKAFDEIHFNIGNKIVHNVFDQNRYGASIQYMPKKSFGFEVGYINWFQQRKSGIDFYNRNIIRFTIHHNINLKK